jgi:hypothetical protein
LVVAAELEDKDGGGAIRTRFRDTKNEDFRLMALAETVKLDVYSGLFETDGPELDEE